jgi:ankyrin repeat protein
MSMLRTLWVAGLIMAVGATLACAFADDLKSSKAAGAAVPSVQRHIFIPTPLHKAILARNYEQAKRVIAAGADLNADVVNMGPPLDLAIIDHDAIAVALLIDAGANVNARRQPAGDEPLQVAAKLQLPDLVKLLLDKGADIDDADNDGITALYVASEAGALNVVQLLVERGARVDVRDNSGGTPLHQAAKYTKGDVAAFLLQHGADINARDTQGLSPLAVALRENATGPLVDLLRSHGGKP